MVFCKHTSVFLGQIPRNRTAESQSLFIYDFDRFCYQIVLCQGCMGFCCHQEYMRVTVSSQLYPQNRESNGWSPANLMSEKQYQVYFNLNFFHYSGDRASFHRLKNHCIFISANSNILFPFLNGLYSYPFCYYFFPVDSDSSLYIRHIGSL